MESGFSRLLSDAPEGKGFYTDFGEIKNLVQLKVAITEKGGNFYSSYADNNNNHFANWVEAVFEDSVLANGLRESVTYEQAIKALDDRLKYAELYLAFNTKKDMLNDYLTNGKYSIKQVMNTSEFSPEHHRFETIFDMDVHSITRLSPPKTTFMQNLKTDSHEKHADAHLDFDVMRNATLLNSTTKLKQKTDTQAEKEKAAFSYLERMFPGVTNSYTGENKNLFEKFFAWISSYNKQH